MKWINVINVLFDIVLFYSYHKFLDNFLVCKEKNKLKLILMWIVIGGINNLFYFVFDNPYVNLVTNVTGIFIMAFIAYNGWIREKILFSILLQLVEMIIELIVSYSLAFFYNGVVDLEKTGFYINLIFCCRMILFFTVMTLQLISKKKNRSLPLTYWIMIFLISCSNIILASNLFMTVGYSTSVISLISFVTIMFVNIFLFILYERVQEKTELEYMAKLYQQEAQYYEKYYEELRKTNEITRTLRHDMKNHLIAIKSLAQEENNEKIIQFVNQMGELGKLEKKIITTGNMIVDSIVNYKAGDIKENQIKFEHNIKIPDEMNLESTALCSVLGNALDNAIEANKYLSEQERYMLLEMSISQNNLFILLENKYDGMIKTERNQLITRKRDKGSHGIGIQSMQEIIEKNNGSMKINYDNGKFSLKIMFCNIV